MHMELEFIDISTCEPIEDLMIDVWHANATGVYSGVAVSGNGDGTSDPGNIDKTFLRGLQPTDSEGVAQFDTIFPGHYEGRAIHFHLIAHQNGTILPNSTYSGGAISHVGQIFFEESLRAQVEANEPYSSNTQALTTNDEDMWAPDQAENDYDPFPEYVLLGDTVEEGLLMWISVGIDRSANYTSTVSVAGELTADGGVAESGSSASGDMGGTGNGMGGGNGTAPAGMGGNGTSLANGTVSSGSNGTSANATGFTQYTSSSAAGSSSGWRSAAVVVLVAMWLSPLAYL